MRGIAGRLLKCRHAASAAYCAEFAFGCTESPQENAEHVLPRLALLPTCQPSPPVSPCAPKACQVRVADGLCADRDLILPETGGVALHACRCTGVAPTQASARVCAAS